LPPPSPRFPFIPAATYRVFWLFPINPGSLPIAQIIHDYYVRRSNNLSIILELANRLWENRDANPIDSYSEYKDATVTSKD
jgi:hypothetical protein